MSKHTPGPWATDDRCLVIKQSKDKQMFKTICDTEHGDYGVDEGQANARLIAAAPELLEACISLCRNVPMDAASFNIGGAVKHSLRIAAAAIAKAKGVTESDNAEYTSF